jgi:hypothetical protein
MKVSELLKSALDLNLVILSGHPNYPDYWGVLSVCRDEDTLYIKIQREGEQDGG